jgi:transposase-like protein
VDKQGFVVPLGSWSGESWDEIAQEIKGKRQDNQPVAEVLVSDGERGLSEALADLCNEHQRCSWHFVHDLNFTMWQAGAPKTERDAKQEELINIIGIELPEEDFQAVSSQEQEEIASKLDKARNDLERLSDYLISKGYDEAAGYVKRGGKNIFTYLERWLKTGLITPRVSSMIERMMREIARRLKRIAFGWSPAGAAKMARIIIKRFTSAAQWEQYWKNRLKIHGKILMVLRDVRVVSPQPLGR